LHATINRMTGRRRRSETRIASCGAYASRRDRFVEGRT
jgi:hypothetical protein